MATRGKKTDRGADPEEKQATTESSPQENGTTLTFEQQARILKSMELMAKTRPMNIDELMPYQRNQKDHPEEQVRNLANSLRRFGWRQPVVIDRNNVIVIGHGRVLGAKMLGLVEAPVAYADDLTEDEIRELRIIDNKLNESDWNKFLEEDLQELTFDGFDLEFDQKLSNGGGVLMNQRSRKTTGTRTLRKRQTARKARSTSLANIA